MTWIIGTIILGLAVVLCLIATGFVKGQEVKRFLRIASGGCLAILLILTVVVSLHQVGAGEVGVVYEFGQIVGQREPGLQMTTPWQSLVTASVQVQSRKFEGINGFSKETQDVFIGATLNYSVSPSAVQSLYRNVGPDWFNKLIESRVNNYFKEETVKYLSVDVAPNREAIRVEVRKKLAENLEPYSIAVNDLLIDNIDFRPEFKTAIEQKQIAKQDALRETARVEQRRAEAQQNIETAKGDAESKRIRAQGDSDANKLLTASLSPQVIQWEALKRLSDKMQIVLLPSGQGMILDPSTFLGVTKTTTP